MQIFRDLAGYSMGASDMVRRAVAKKQADVLAAQKKYFLYGSDGSDGSSPCCGCLANGITEEAANGIFDDMAAFASYAFNKSHSAAYAYITFQTAWLRCHYPAEFMAAMLTINLSNTDKMVPYIAECGNLGVKVLPPHINESEKKFSVVDGSIRFGLLAIKNVGEAFIDLILDERARNGKFRSFYDFCKRTYGKEFNRRAVENFIKAGAIDGLGWNRRQMLLMLEEVVSGLDSDKKKNIDGQMGLFDLVPELAEESEPVPPDVPEIEDRDRLQLEKAITGLYISGHPIGAYAKIAKAYHAARIDELLASSLSDPTGYKNQQKVTLVCILASVKKKITKNDTTMAFLQAEDTYGSIEVVVFPKGYTEFGDRIAEDRIVIIRGRLSLSDDKQPSIALESIEPAPSPEEFSAGQRVPPPEYETPDFLKSSYTPAAQPAPAAAEEETVPDRTPELAAIKNSIVKAKKGIFLRFPSKSDPSFGTVNGRISGMRERIPVMYYFTDTNTYELNTGIRIPYDYGMILEFSDLLGEKNVVIR